MGERDSDRDAVARNGPGAATRAVNPRPDVVVPSDAASSRRGFMRLVGGAGGVMGASTLLAACGSSPRHREESEDPGEAAQPGSDLEVLNYLLYLEYLEQDFYDRALSSGTLSAESRSLAEQVRQEEREHVDLLEGLVQQFAGAPLPRPKTDFDAVIQAGEQRILQAAATIENLGAAAYLGQVTNIQDNPLLETVLTIHSVEGRHAAALNQAAGNGFVGSGPLVGSIPDGAFAEPMTREDVLEAAEQYVSV